MATNDYVPADERRVLALLRDKYPRAYDALLRDARAAGPKRGRPPKFVGPDCRGVRTGTGAARERAAEWWRLFADEGWTFQQIGERDGMSRERVRQVVQRYYGQALIDLARDRNERRKRHRRWVENARWKVCMICGRVATDRSRVDCQPEYASCPDHVPFQHRVRLMIDPIMHAQHAFITARRRPGRSRPWPVVTPGKRVHRWLQHGSEMHALMTEAYRKGWPVIDRLPDDIREQLAVEAGDQCGANPRPRTEEAIPA